jgi:hypothetical protein
MTAIGWVKVAPVIVWNGYSCYRAYKDFTALKSADVTYWTDLRSYLKTYNPLFVKIAKATPPTWDDDIFAGIEGALASDALWQVLVKTLKQYKQQDDKNDESNPPVIIKRRILQRLFQRNINESGVELPAESDDEAGFGITEVLLILSILNASGNMWSFVVEIVQWLRDRKTARKLRRDSMYDSGDEN